MVVIFLPETLWSSGVETYPKFTLNVLKAVANIR